MTNKLIGVILRFHEGKVAVMGDIEAMFHQVNIAKEHKDAIRFLWWLDGDKNKFIIRRWYTEPNSKLLRFVQLFWNLCILI